MALYLVRHAKAGKRGRFDGDDTARPLDAVGLAQSEAIATRLGDLPVPALHSSPYRRCIQTLEPLAQRLGLLVSPDERLAEGADAHACVEWLTTLPDHVVLCSHGDLIPEVVDLLVRRGMDVVGEPNTRKGSTWVFERTGGVFVSARAWPPPKVD